MGEAELGRPCLCLAGGGQCRHQRPSAGLLRLPPALPPARRACQQNSLGGSTVRDEDGLSPDFLQNFVRETYHWQHYSGTPTLTDYAQQFTHLFIHLCLISCTVPLDRGGKEHVTLARR